MITQKKNSTIMETTTKKTNIIGFAGRKQSGKTTLAKSLKEKNPNTTIVTIADNLKLLCCELLNVTYDKLNEMKEYNTIFHRKVDGRWVSIIHAKTNISEEDIFNEIGGQVFTTVRDMLQVIGTDLIRKYYADWHIDKTIEQIKQIICNDKDTLVVVDDVRFPNEKKKIEELGGDVYFIIRPNWFNVSNHISEVSLQYTNFCDDKVLINDLPLDNFANNFFRYYFLGEKCVNLVSENPWYTEHAIDMETESTQFNIDRGAIIKLVVEENKDTDAFRYNGIITFKSTDNRPLQLFRRIIMNDRRNSDGCSAYSVYNPITNEILKKYL